jgi:hypothetical protein
VTTPLLTYSLATEPFPLQASAATGGLSPATLTIVATNATGAPVPLQAVQITIPVGPGVTGLTPDPSGIGPVPPPGWPAATVSYLPGAAAWVFLAPGGSFTVPAYGSLAFSFNQLQVNRAPGDTQVRVMEGSGECSPPACPTQVLAISKFPSGWGTVSFWATPVVVQQGGGPTLGWSGPAGADYQIVYYTPQTGVVLAPAAGQTPFAPQGEYPPATDPLSLQQTTTFTLQVSQTVAGQPYAAQCQVTVTVEVPAPVITSFGGTLGGSGTEPTLTLHWTTQNAMRCVIGGFSEELTPNGSWPSQIPLQMPLALSYTLTAWNAANVATTATWYVPPVIASFAGAPRVTVQGQTVDVALELSWATVLAESCALTGVSGTVGPGGTTTITPGVAAPLATGYTLTAGNGPQTTTATVHVAWGASGVEAQPMPGILVGVAAAPDGGSVLLSVNGSQGTVVRLDSRTLAVTGSSPGLPLMPSALAVSPDGSRVFVGQFSVGLMVLDGTTLQPVGSPTSQVEVSGLAATPDGRRLVVSVPGGVTALDAATLEPLGVSVSLSPRPRGVAVSPDGARVYVACASLSGNGDGRVAVLDATTLQPVAGSPVTIPNAQAVSVSADGALVFAACAYDTEKAGVPGSLTVIDAATLQPIPPAVPLDDVPMGAATAADGSRVFVCGAGLGILTLLVPSAVTPAG